MPDIILKNRDGDDVTYSGIETVSFDTPTEGQQAVYTYGVVADNPEISLDLANGDQVVSVPDGVLVKTATIKKPGTLLPENIVEDVEIAGVVGTREIGVIVQGILEEYKVLSGCNISAGSFVEIINKMTEPICTLNNASMFAPSAILLSDNRVFVAHSGPGYSLYGTIVTIVGTEVTAICSQLISASYSCNLAPSAILLSNDKVFIAHAYSTSNYLYGTIVTISGTAMTAVTSQLSSSTYSCNLAPSAILLSDDKVFIAHAYSTSNYLYGTIVTISGTAMTAVSSKLNSSSASCADNPSAVCITGTKVFIAHAYGSSKYLYGTIVTISGTTMTANSSKLNTFTQSCYYGPSAVLLSSNKVFVAHSYNGSGRTLYGTIVTISGTTMSGVSTYLNLDNYSCNKAPAAALIAENKVYIAHSHDSGWLRECIVTVSGTSITVDTTDWISNERICGMPPSVVQLDSGEVVIVHALGFNSYPMYATMLLSQSLVAPASYGGTITGIASKSGGSEETIEIYVPNPAN